MFCEDCGEKIVGDIVTSCGLCGAKYCPDCAQKLDRCILCKEGAKIAAEESSKTD